MPVVLMPSPTAIESMVKSGSTPPDPIECLALIDTGSPYSVIKESYCDDLHLMKFGMGCRLGNASTMHGEERPLYPTYRVHMTLDGQEPKKVTMARMPLDNDQNIGLILGRDWLSNVVMTYNGPENTLELS